MSCCNSVEAIMSPVPMPKTPEERAALKMQLRKTVWPLLDPTANDVTWQRAGGKTVDTTGVVYKAWHSGLKETVWKVEVILPTSMDKYTQLVRNLVVDWVPHLEKVEIVEQDSSDPTWWVAHEFMLRIYLAISPRDFIAMHFVEELPDTGAQLVMLTGVEHPSCPKLPNYVRGEYLPSGSIARPIEGEPNKISFTWSNNVDLKGFVPKKIIEMANASFLLETCQALVAKCKTL